MKFLIGRNRACRRQRDNLDPIITFSIINESLLGAYCILHLSCHFESALADEESGFSATIEFVDFSLRFAQANLPLAWSKWHRNINYLMLSVISFCAEKVNRLWYLIGNCLTFSTVPHFSSRQDLNSADQDFWKILTKNKGMIANIITILTRRTLRLITFLLTF